MNIFKRLRKKKNADPLDYGWDQDMKGEFHKGEYYLENSDLGWTLHKLPKEGPGCVFKCTTLGSDEMETINGLVEAKAKNHMGLNRYK